MGFVSLPNKISSEIRFANKINLSAPCNLFSNDCLARVSLQQDLFLALFRLYSSFFQGLLSMSH